MHNIHYFLNPLTRTVVQIVVVTIAFTILSFGLIHPRTVIFTGDYEIVYEESWESSACVMPASCYLHYRLTLGNTGRKIYKDIELHFTGLPADMRRWNIYTVELESTTRKIPKATSSDIDGLSYSGLQVHDLHPGTAIVVEFVNQQMPRDAAQRLLDKTNFVHVLAKGSVLEGNPRATFFARLMTFYL